MHNRDKSSSQQRKNSNHEQKHNSTKNIKEEHMSKNKDSSMYANQLNKYQQQYSDSVSNKGVVQNSQKHQQKNHHDKSHANLQNNLSPSTHMVPNQNAMNPIGAQANNLLNANATLNQNMMQTAKNSSLGGVNEQQHHIQNTHHQDLTGNTTPNSNTTELKQHTSPSTDIPSMGVYTPDSTTNSVHSLHHSYQCDLDVAQLGLESPASIASDIASQNSVENVRPPSVASHSQMNQFSDCSIQQQHQQQTNQAHIHMAIQHHQQQQTNAARGGYQLVPNEIPMNHQQNAQNQQQNSNRKMAQQSQQQHMQAVSAQQVRATNNRSVTPKATPRNTSTPSLQQQQQHAASQRAQRTATPNTVQQQMVSPNQQIHNLNMQQHMHNQQAQNQHQNQQVHQQNLDVQQIDQYNNHLSNAVHGHHQMHQDYLGVPQMATAQNYPSQSPNSYGTLPMTSVIQHRMSGNHSNLTTHNPLPSPHQRLGPSPSSCSVGSNFYAQNANVPHPVSHTPVPQARTPSATPTLQQQMNAVGNNDGQAANNSNIGGNQSIAGNVSSLSKLQQLTNGLEIAPCNTPPASLNLTPSPNHHPHNTMTPPPSHLVNQNRNLPTPPSAAQIPSLPYHKYYSSNIPQHIPIAQNTSRTARNTASAPVQHMSAGSPSSRVSPNVTLSSNLISPYSSALNGYRMTAQQPSGYISNSAAGFINNPSQLQMANMANVMNMQSQYQVDQRAAAQQNSMLYSNPTAYPYIHSAMRR